MRAPRALPQSVRLLACAALAAAAKPWLGDVARLVAATRVLRVGRGLPAARRRDPLLGVCGAPLWAVALVGVAQANPWMHEPVAKLGFEWRVFPDAPRLAGKRNAMTKRGPWSRVGVCICVLDNVKMYLRVRVDFYHASSLSSSPGIIGAPRRVARACTTSPGEGAAWSAWRHPVEWMWKSPCSFVCSAIGVV